MSTHIETDKLVRTFIRMRDRRRELAAAFTKEDDQLKANMRAVENELLRRAQEDGVEGYKTDAGTTYTAEEVHASIAVADDFHAFVLQAGDLDFYEQRPSLKHIQEYRARNSGAAPPGIKLFREMRMRIRASKFKLKTGEANDA